LAFHGNNRLQILPLSALLAAVAIRRCIGNLLGLVDSSLLDRVTVHHDG
jgi:hypothetical protein